MEPKLLYRIICLNNPVIYTDPTGHEIDNQAMSGLENKSGGYHDSWGGGAYSESDGWADVKGPEQAANLAGLLSQMALVDKLMEWEQRPEMWDFVPKLREMIHNHQISLVSQAELGKWAGRYSSVVFMNPFTGLIQSVANEKIAISNALTSHEFDLALAHELQHSLDTQPGKPLLSKYCREEHAYTVQNQLAQQLSYTKEIIADIPGFIAKEYGLSKEDCPK